jgi:hypothetical protein
VTSDHLARHLQTDQYGRFRLTDAIRPAFDLAIVPCEGYRLEKYEDPAAAFSIPVIAAAVSRERLFDCFLSLLEPLGDLVNVVLETSHETSGSAHADLHREAIDRPVLESYCWDFQDLLINDGCTGVAVAATDQAMEVQFDEHKLLIVYAQDLRPFQDILEQNGTMRDDSLRLITEAEHLHTSDARYFEEFSQLSARLGAVLTSEHVNG